MMTVSETAALVWSVRLMAIGRFGLVLSSLSLGSKRGLSEALISQSASAIYFMRQLGSAVGIGRVGMLAALSIGPGAAALTAAGAGEPLPPRIHGPQQPRP